MRGCQRGAGDVVGVRQCYPVYMHDAIKDPHDWRQALSLFSRFIAQHVPETFTAHDRERFASLLAEYYESAYAPTLVVEYTPLRDVTHGRFFNNRRYEHTFGRIRGALQPVLRIDPTLRDGVLSTTDRASLQRLEDAVRRIGIMASHDFIAHASGINTYSNVVDVVADVVEFERGPYEILPAERLAILVHRVLFERATAAYPAVRRFIEKEVRAALAVIARIPDDQVDCRREWTRLIAYLAHTLLDPEEARVHAIYTAFPVLAKDLQPSFWSRTVHQKKFPLHQGGYLPDTALFDSVFLSDPAADKEATRKKLLAAARH